MKYLKSIGLFVAGGACIVVGVFVPPAQAFLGPVGVKLIVAAGAGALVGSDPKQLTEAVKATVAAVRRPGKGQSGS